MAPLRAFYLFIASLTFAAHFAIASAQDAPVLDLPRETITDGQSLRDNVLLLPLYGQLAKSQLDGLLVSPKFWSRQQQVTCTTNYTICQGTQFCCPGGNVCCSGQFLRLFFLA